MITEQYSCKFAGECRDFSVKNYCCLHGGGVSCKAWRWKSDVVQFGVEGARRLRRF